jgi:hypothetical protein
MASKIVRTFKDPGLPRIDVVQKLRTSVESEMNKVDKSVFATYDVASYQNDQGPQMFVGRGANKDDGLLGFATFFDKGKVAQLVDDINKQMYEKGERELRNILQRGKQKAQKDIRGMRRAFKSRFKSSTPSEGDIYNRLADSLDFNELQEGNRQRQRFQRYIAGSYDINNISGSINKNEPTGYRGSRYDESPPRDGKSLTERYMRGRRASNRAYKTTISESAKRLKGHFK